MKSRICIAAISLVAWLGIANAEEVHLLGPGGGTKEPLSPTGMQKRVAAAAQEYQKYGQVPRVALYDIAYPADSEEFKQMGGFGVVLVVCQSQKSSELPPKRLFIRSGVEEVELDLLTCANSESAPDSLVRTVFGPYRWEGIYLFPLRAQSIGAELVMDYQVNRKGFVLTKFKTTGISSAGFAAELPASTGERQKPSNLALMTLVLREFPGFIARLP